MGVNYGHKWTSLIVDDETLQAMKSVWGSMVEAYSLDVIRDALKRVPSDYLEWPPTAGQFAEICKACVVVEYDPALPPPRTKGQTKAGLAALSEMKKILKVT